MEFIQFTILGGFDMTIKQLQEKEKMLNDRVKRLKSEIAATKENLTEKDIPVKAEEIHSLEIQLELTESVFANTQKLLSEQEKLLNSKDYADKMKRQEKLREQATSKTRSIYEKLVEIQVEAKEVFDLCNQFDKLHRETSKVENSMQWFINLDSKQPFSWLRVISNNVSVAVKRAKYIKDKLKV